MYICIPDNDADNYFQLSESDLVACPTGKLHCSLATYGLEVAFCPRLSAEKPGLQLELPLKNVRCKVSCVNLTSFVLIRLLVVSLR